MNTNERRVKAQKKDGYDLFGVSRVRLGERIAELRKAQKMTQEDVAAILGCSNSTISRLERGEIMPTRYQLAPMLQLFNLSLDEALSLLLDGGNHFEDNAFNELRGAVRDEDYGRLREFLTQIDEKSLVGKKLYRRLYLFARVLTEPALDAQTAVNRLTGALRVLRGAFSLDGISACRLSFDELTIISEIGRRYLDSDEVDNAAEIFKAAADSMDRYYFNERLKCEMYPDFLYNLSVCYGKQGRHQEAEQVCQKAKELAVKYSKFDALPYLLYNIGIAKFQQGDRVGCRTMIVQAYVSAVAMGKPSLAEYIKVNAENELGIDVSAIEKQLSVSEDRRF